MGVAVQTGLAPSAGAPSLGAPWLARARTAPTTFGAAWEAGKTLGAALPSLAGEAAPAVVVASAWVVVPSWKEGCRSLAHRSAGPRAPGNAPAPAVPAARTLGPGSPGLVVACSSSSQVACRGC